MNSNEAQQKQQQKEQQQQQQQQQQEGLGARCFEDPQTLLPMLKHTSLNTDQHVLLLLQRTSKQLQAAIAEHCIAQLRAVLHTTKVQHVAAFCSWLRKHSCLLNSLDVRLIHSSSTSGTLDWSASVAALAATLQESATTGSLQLQECSLRGCPASVALLQALQAAQVTQLSLDAGLQLNSINTSQHSIHNLNIVHSHQGRYQLLQKLAPLTALCSLHLTGSGPAATEDDGILALLASLQQLTELHIGPARPVQLLQLPTSLQELQQLHVAVDLGCDFKRIVQLASWLEQHCSSVVALSLGGGGSQQHAPGWAAALSAAGASANAFNASLIEEEPGAADIRQQQHGSLTRDHLRQQQLQFLRSVLVASGAPWGPILQRLQPSVVTHLVCPVDLTNAAQMQALCALTGLQSLWVCEARGSLHREPGNEDMLVPLSALLQLTQLRLERVRQEQLSLLQLPQLQQLQVELCLPYMHGRPVLVLRGKGEGLAYNDMQLNLGHLTVLTALRHAGRGNCGLQESDVLPPGLQELEWVGCQSSCSIQPLLALSQLVKLQLTFAEAPAAWQLQQLGGICSLQEVRLDYKRQTQCTPEMASAWLALPVKALLFECTAQCEVQAGVLDVIGELTGLTQLSLGCSDMHNAADAAWDSIAKVEGVMQQLAAMVGKLAALESLSLHGLLQLMTDSYQDITEDGLRFTGSVRAFAAAVGSLSRLTKLSVKLPFRAYAYGFLKQQQQQIGYLSQLLPNLRMSSCGLYNSRMMGDDWQLLLETADNANTL